MRLVGDLLFVVVVVLLVVPNDAVDIVGILTNGARECASDRPILLYR